MINSQSRFTAQENASCGKMWFLNYLWETDINPSKGKGEMISQKNSLYIDIKFALEN